MRNGWALILTILLIGAACPGPQAAHADNVKKIKTTKLALEGEGQFMHALAIVPFGPTAAGVSPPCGPGFGVFGKFYTPIGEYDSRKHLYFFRYGMDFKQTRKLLLMGDMAGGVFDVQASHLGGGRYAAFAVTENDQRNAYDYQAVAAWKQDSKLQVRRQSLGSVPFPKATTEGGKVLSNGAGVNVYRRPNGLTMWAYANFWEDSDTHYGPQRWTGFYQDYDYSSRTLGKRVSLKAPKYGKTNAAMASPEASCPAYGRNNITSPFAVGVVYQHAKSQHGNYFYLKRPSIVSYDLNWTLDRTSPPAKAKFQTIVHGAEQYRSDFPRVQVLYSDETNGDQQSTLIYQYIEYRPIAFGSLDVDHSWFYLQRLDDNGGPAGNRLPVVKSTWTPRIQPDPNRYIWSSAERLSQLAPLPDGSYLGLLLRHITLSGAPTGPVPSKTLAYTDLQAYAVVLDPAKATLEIVGELTIKGRERDTLDNPITLAHGGKALFYFEITGDDGTAGYAAIADLADMAPDCP